MNNKDTNIFFNGFVCLILIILSWKVHHQQNSINNIIGVLDNTVIIDKDLLKEYYNEIEQKRNNTN